jgi:hypothetical protein
LSAWWAENFLIVIDPQRQEANRLVNVLLSLDVKRDEKHLWCGLNASGIVRMIHAARNPGWSWVS